MTRRVVSVQPETSIEHAKTVLTENRFSALPVVDQYNHLVGVVTGADLLREPSRAATQSRPTTVGAVMTRTPIYMSPDADVNIVAHRMRTYGELRAIPIVDHDFLVGIVTRGDLLRKPPRGGPLGRLLRRVLSRQAVPDPVPYRAPRAGTAARSQYARDVMTTKVVTVAETTPIDVARDRLIRNRFTALPVTDADRRLIGIVSEADLVRDPLNARRTPRPDTVGGVMTTGVVAVEPTATIDDLVRLLSDKGLRLVPVVDGDRLVGVVSRGDLL